MKGTPHPFAGKRSGYLSQDGLCRFAGRAGGVSLCGIFFWVP